MAEQFEVTQQEVAYAPEQATDFVREFDRHIAERDAMAKPYEASIRANAERSVVDANKKVAEMEQLAQLSKSLTNKLTEIQKDANEKEYAKGLADALMEPPDLVGQQELENEETALVKGQSVATQASDRYLTEGGSKANARQIRNTGGWYGYGRFVGQLQNLGDGYSSALLSAKNDFTVNIGGEEKGYDQLQSLDEYNAWQRAFNQNYLSGVPRTNGDVVEKYVLRQMRSSATADRLKWNEKYQKEQDAIEKEERQQTFIAGLGRGDTNLAERAFATYPGSFREIRIQLEDDLIVAVDAGQINTTEADNFYQSQVIVKDGKSQTMAEAFPLQYQQFQDRLEKARTQENNEFTAGLKNEAVELQQILSNQETLTNDQINQLKNSDRYKNNPLAKEVLQAYETAEEIEDDNAREHLEALDRAGQLTPEELKKYNPTIQREFQARAEETATIEGEYDSEAGEDVADGAAMKLSDISQGTTPNRNDLEYQRKFQSASKFHKQMYTLARRSGRNHVEAMEYAFEKVSKDVEDPQTSKIMTGAAPKPISNLSTKVQTTRQYINDKPGAINEVLPDTQVEFDQSYEYMRTGRGSMSGFYQALAQNQPYTAEDIVLAQARARGVDTSKIEKSPIMQEREALPPDLQRLIKVSPNIQTFAQAATRAVLGGQDTKYFLDTVASRESEGYGGYDAYNLGGSAGGHVAHKPGNSAEDGRFGKPVSQLTIGEIKALHRAGKAHAMGRYQFIGPTFAEVAPLTGLPDDAVFNAKTQDLFAITRLIQRASWGNLQSGLASEWIGLQYLNSAQYQKLVKAAYGAIEENQ